MTFLTRTNSTKPNRKAQVSRLVILIELNIIGCLAAYAFAHSI